MKLALLLATLVSLVLVLEVGTRLLTNIQPPLISNHDVLGTTFLPGYEGRVFVPESDQFVDLRFNRDGMRGDEHSRDKAAGIRRIAIVGDSMVAAIGTIEENTAVDVLQTRLSDAHGHESWEVMNFGVSGSATAQELVLYREVVRHYRPDIVVCAFCIWNDFGDNCRQLSSSPHRIYFDLDDRGELRQRKLSKRRSQFSAWLNENSRFYLWQKQAIRVAADRTKRNVGVLQKCKLIYHREPSEELEHAWQITEKLIEAFQREVEQDGSQFVLALLPSADQIHDENWSKVIENAGPLASQMDPDYPSQRLSQLCTRIGVPVIDMVDAFRDAAPSRSRRNKQEWHHYRGLGHFNAAGNRLVANQIYDFLTNSGETVADTRQQVKRR
jgi:lysophospholipase L1-like esterase